MPSTFSIKTRADLVHFIDVFLRAPDATCTDDRVNQEALRIFDSDPPDYLSREAFDALRWQVHTKIIAKIIDEFLQAMDTFGITGFERSEIEWGYLNLSQKFTGNPSDEIWQAISKLGFLTHLDLSENRLTAISPLIGQMTKLKGLKLYNNALENLPIEMESLVDLVGLNLGHNKFTEVDPAIFRLVNLEALNLSSNQLSSVPSAICTLQKLRRLDLSMNPILQILPQKLLVREVVTYGTLIPREFIVDYPEDEIYGENDGQQVP